LSIEEDIAIFERVPALRLLGHDALRVLAIGAESRHVEDGEVLFYAGDPAESGYVIQEGSFRLEPGGPTAEKETTAGPGMLLGELALLTQTVRASTATAREPSAVIRIPRNLFLKVMQSYPEAAAKLRDQIGMRVAAAAKELDSVRAQLKAGDAPKGP